MTSRPARLEAAVGLSLVAAAGVRGVLVLLHAHDCVDIWRADRSTLVRWVGAKAWVSRFAAARSGVSPGSVLEAASKVGIRFIIYGDTDYPSGLCRLRYPPAGLFAVGAEVAAGSVAAAPRVTIVGTRRATAYGASVARRLGRDFADRGIAVLSGLALGVDGHAHRGALEAGGLTAAVLGCGPDVVYPRRHAELYRRVAAAGVVYSEYPPGTRPSPWSFPERNRLLAAMGDAVVVVEAPSRSGALITVHHAIELGKDVFAVPGPILGAESDGCNGLLYDGAIPCVDTRLAVEDFLRVTRMERGARDVPRPTPEVSGVPALSGSSQDLVVLALSAGARDIEDIARAAGLDAREASVASAVTTTGTESGTAAGNAQKINPGVATQVRV